MQIDEADAMIDKSVWLPDGEPLITIERAAKGDMTIFRNEDDEIVEAKVTIANILNWFFDSGIINDEQNNAGHCFEAWRNQHRVALGLQNSVSGGQEASIGTKLRAHGYILLLRRLSCYDQKAITQAIDTPSTEHTRFFAARDKHIYRSAFVRLAIAIVPIKERISYLEQLSEAERDALSDDNLKNYIAEIINYA